MARCQTHSESVNPVNDVCTARHDSQGMRWQVKPYEECEVKSWERKSSVRFQVKVFVKIFQVKVWLLAASLAAMADMP